MKSIFADTFYWAALINPRDDAHQQVRQLSRLLSTATIVTTDEVLIEVLNFFSGFEPEMRQATGQLINRILTSPKIQVIEQTHSTFLEGFNLYQQRRDKEYSLTDCISMNAMWLLNMTEVLTHDKHFTQEGFRVLL